MAGLVNTQCGIPLIMEQGNSGASFVNFLGEADCVASWFGTQGYQTEFIRGSQKEFAGGINSSSNMVGNRSTIKIISRKTFLPHLMMSVDGEFMMTYCLSMHGMNFHVCPSRSNRSCYRS